MNFANPKKSILLTVVGIPILAGALFAVPIQQQTAHAAIEAGIKPIQCNYSTPGDGTNARWLNPDGSLKTTLTYKIVKDAVQIKDKQVQAVVNGVEEWNEQSPYTLQRVDSSSNADIVISLKSRIGSSGSASGGIPDTRTASGLASNSFTSSNIIGCYISGGQETIALNGRFTSASDYTGLQNVAAHETGHILGLGHANYSGDLMYGNKPGSPSSTGSPYEVASTISRVICPSNLDTEALNTNDWPYFVDDWHELDC
jgi:hypothetical protein